ARQEADRRVACGLHGRERVVEAPLGPGPVHAADRPLRRRNRSGRCRVGEPRRSGQERAFSDELPPRSLHASLRLRRSTSLPRLLSSETRYRWRRVEGRMTRSPTSAVALLAVLLAAMPARADDDWIATWTASPQEVWAPDFLAPVKVPRNLWDQTLRQVARVSLGGRRVRVVLSNECGRWPFKVGAAQIARSDKGAAIVAGARPPPTLR